jgi:hypothetical protein
VTAQTIVTIRGHKGQWSLHDRNRDGSITVFGPVLWNEKQGRWVGATKGKGAKYRCVPAEDVSPVQLAMVTA